MPFEVACRGMRWPTQLWLWTEDVARYLVEVEGCAIGEDCDVDRLAGALGQKFGNRAGLLDDVETGSGGSGKAEDAQPQTVLSAMLVLFDEAASLKRRDDAGGR